MADHEISSVAIVAEPVFCLRDATTNLPDLSLVSIGDDDGWAVERANFFESPEQAAVEMDLTRQSFNEQLLEPLGIVNNTGAAYMGVAEGEMIPVIRGTLNLRARLNNTGDVEQIILDGGTPAYSQPDLLKWVIALKSNYGVHLPGTRTDIVVSATDAAEYEPTTVGDYTAGQGIAVIRNNALEMSVVSEIVTGPPDAIKLATELPGGALGVGAEVRHCCTIYPRSGTAGTSFLLQFDMEGKRMYALGCKVTGFTLSPQDGAVIGNFVIEPTLILRDDASAATVAYVPSDGFMLQELGGCSVMATGNTRSATSPGKQPVTELKTDTWEVAIESTGHREPDKKWLGGASAMSISGAQPTITLASSPDSTLENSLRRRETRSMLLIAGPAGPGEGLGVFIGATARSNTNMNITNQDGRQVQGFTLRAVDYLLDDNAEPAPANTAWRLLLPM